MEFVFILSIVAVGLAIINLILLVLRIIQKRVSIVIGLFIIMAAGFIPYTIAVVAASTATGWGGLDRGLSAWVWSGFILMILLTFYLTSVKKVEISKKDNDELLDD
jgi:hypothetical protein